VQFIIFKHQNLRFDRGVHVLQNTARFDWITPIDITNLVQLLNVCLFSRKKINKCVFYVHMLSQHNTIFVFIVLVEIYRLGFLNENEFSNINTDISFLRKKRRYLLRDITSATYNLFEKDHITYVEPPYDLNAFRKGIEVFQVN